jgi:hypothetical protein
VLGDVLNIGFVRGNAVENQALVFESYAVSDPVGEPEIEHGDAAD